MIDAFVFTRHNSAFPRRNASELWIYFPPKEGVGNAGRPMHPQPGGQKRVDSRTSSSHHEFTGKHPAFPHAMVLTGYFVLSPVIGLSCHRRKAENSAELDASVEASGPHDFAVRK
jgi:hypothetical protein